METRPQSFREYIGQPKAKKVLEILAFAARKQQRPVAHLLLTGPAGLGKTSLARILAHETGSRMVEVVGPNLEHPKQLQAQLMGLQERDILFIDEVHAMSREVEETLYSALEDGVISYIPDTGYGSVLKAIGGQSRAQLIKLPPFTVLGATTLPGLLSAPLRSRFVQSLQLEPYSVDELKQIVMGAGKKMKFPVPAVVAKEIARRSRNTARTAIANLTWYKEYVMADGGVPTMEALEQAFSLKDIDAHGLTPLDRKYLKLLVNANTAVGLSTLSASLNEDPKSIESTVEPYLLREGLICRCARGRIAEKKAFELKLEAV